MSSAPTNKEGNTKGILGKQLDGDINNSDNVDIFKDTSVRYFGYANEVGEAFAPLFKRFVAPSYYIAFSYVFADTADKVIAAHNNSNESQKTNSNSHSHRNNSNTISAIASSIISSTAVVVGIDTLLWQTFASVLIPGKVINIVTNTASNYISKSKISNTLVRKWGATGVGLAAIPFIIKPIDNAVDYVFDNTLRTVLKRSNS